MDAGVFAFPEGAKRVLVRIPWLDLTTQFDGGFWQFRN
jgi:hypothetical protein